MGERQKAVFAIFQNRSQVERGIELLKSEGFMNSDISVLLPTVSGSQDLVHSKDTKAPEGAAIGAGAGAVFGGALGLLVGVGMLAIPGTTPFIAAGPIMSALAGVGLGGTVGGLSGALIGLGVPEYEAKRFEGSVNEGGILLSVHTYSPENADKAKATLEKAGATDVAASLEVAKRESWTSQFFRRHGSDDRSASRKSS